MVNQVRELVPLLVSGNIDASVRFYRDRLGFTLAKTWEPEGELEWCRLERDGAAVMLQRACDEDGPADGRGLGVRFYFICDDVRAEYERLRTYDLDVMPPTVAFYGMNQLFVTDPDGYELCFETPVGSDQQSN